MCQIGLRVYHGGDYDSAAKYWGDVTAHFLLAHSYHEGDVVEKDEEKAVYHYEKAAIGGHPCARHNLGCYEEENGNVERSVKHTSSSPLMLEMRIQWKRFGGIIQKETSPKENYRSYSTHTQGCY